jgi:hypothetical protein
MEDIISGSVVLLSQPAILNLWAMPKNWAPVLISVSHQGSE